MTFNSAIQLAFIDTWFVRNASRGKENKKEDDCKDEYK